MKVLVANWFSSRGGEEKHVFDTVSHLAAREGMELYVAAPRQSPWSRELADLKNVGRVDVDFSSKADLRSVLRLSRVMRKVGFDIVHVHGARAGWLVRLAAWLVGYPRVVWTMHLLIKDHISRQPSWSKRFYSAIERFLNRRTASIIAVSENLRQGLLASDSALEPSKVVSIPNGIAPPKTPRPSSFRNNLGIGASSTVCVAVGKLQREKGHDVLIRALAAIPEGRRPHAAIAGTGMLRDELDSLASSLGVRDFVHLLGFQDNVLGILDAADIFVMPSRYEGFPIALLEAMALGKPIIATAVNGIPEAIENAYNGLLVPSEDDKALAAALLQFIEDPARAARLGAEAKRTFEARYTLERCCDRIKEVYASVAA